VAVGRSKRRAGRIVTKEAERRPEANRRGEHDAVASSEQQLGHDVLLKNVGKLIRPRERLSWMRA